MQSKKSFCNKTLSRKNMGRFAPLWLVYTLCLLLIMAIMYMDDGQDFWFANRMGEMIQIGALINLFYGPAVAMLLFGDLYNSRMCNGLHAMPLKRGTLFRTHILSGLAFSLIPTGIFCGLSVPLLMQSCVVNGWQIALWTFLGMNLSFLCFFGIAVFSALCVGNWFALLAVYAILNGGAFVVYFLIDSIYTPMLYGFVTSTTWAEALTPIGNLLEGTCLELDSFNDLQQLYIGRMEQMRANYHLYLQEWTDLGIWAAVGVGFMALAGGMYRRRKLEAAGDAVAIKGLKPVFQICISICTAAAFCVFADLFLGYRFREQWQYLFLGTGLIIGWFGGRMLIERTARVFRLKNFLGLALLAAVLGGTLAAVHYDVMGWETWIPTTEEVKSVTFGYSPYRGMSQELTEDADIAKAIRLQELALKERLTEGGTHYYMDGEPVDWEYMKTPGPRGEITTRQTSNLYIDYVLENGRTVSRQYIIWADGEEGEILNEYLSRWEVVSKASYYEEMAQIGDLGTDALTYLYVEGNPVPLEFCGTSSVESLLEAIQADCEERTMTQRSAFHTGYFTYVDTYGDEIETSSIWVEFSGLNAKSGSFSVFADSRHTLAWLWERGLLSYEVHLENN